MSHTRRVGFHREEIIIVAALIAFWAVGCGREADRAPRRAAESVTLDPVTAKELAEHTRALADDRMMGRGTGEEGQAVTLEYLQAAYERIGLAAAGDTSLPGAEPGSPQFLQQVDLVGITADAGTATLSFRGGAGAPVLELGHGEEFVTWAGSPEEVVDVSGSVVFAGYGIDAPEEGWDDFGNIDVAGKILLAMPGEPPTADSNRFDGEAMTYYGRWTYKIEEAARRGAAGVLLIHDPDTAGYSWERIKGWTGEFLQTADRSKLPRRTPFQGWISGDAAAKIFNTAGLDPHEVASAAAEHGFSAVDLGLIATGHLGNTVRQVTSYNVVGAVEGSDPTLAEEHLIFVAHWDHLGIGEEIDGDAIYNGAIDNAVGTAALLEVAAAWASTEPAPRRSALFIATTAEESGFLGVVSYIENPVVPLAETVAAINIDGVNVFGPTKDVWIVGEGLSTLQDDLVAVLAEQNRRLSPDPAPEQGNFFRSDHFPFALAGIPALCVRPGESFVGKPEGYGREVWTDYYTTRYHQPSDEFDETWDFDSTAEDVQLMLEVALRVSAADTRPRWNPPGSAYKAARDAMLRSRSQ